MKAVDFARMDRTAFSVRSLSDEHDHKAYWKSKTPLERPEAGELMRPIIYGYDPATIRLQRVLRLANSSNADNLLIDGYAVNYYGYPRATADLDFWGRR